MCQLDLKSLQSCCRPIFVSLTILMVVSFCPGGSHVCRSTRRAANFPVHQGGLYNEKPSYMGAKYCDNLPEDFKMCNVETFKMEVKWLFVNPFYTVEEYLRIHMWKWNNYLELIIICSLISLIVFGVALNLFNLMRLPLSTNL